MKIMMLTIALAVFFSTATVSAGPTPPVPYPNPCPLPPRCPCPLPPAWPCPEPKPWARAETPAEFNLWIMGVLEDKLKPRKAVGRIRVVPVNYDFVDTVYSVYSGQGVMDILKPKPKPKPRKFFWVPRDIDAAGWDFLGPGAGKATPAMPMRVPMRVPGAMVPALD